MNGITRKSVLIECLELQRNKLRMYSKNGRMLEPIRGSEDLFREQQEKCKILEELIHAYDSEPVRAALHGWQEQIMKEDAEGKPHQLTI